MLESKVQSKIINHLQKEGWFVLKVIRCNIPGFNDIVCFRNKVSVFIEAKAPGKDSEEIQKFRHKQLRVQGFDVYTVDSYEEYLKLKL